MKKLIALILILVVNNPPIFADDPVIINKDDKAPFSGLLFSKDKAANLKNAVLERDALKQTNQSLQKSLDLRVDTQNQLETKVNLLSKDNDTLANNLRTERDANKYTYIFYFALGVIATSAAFYGARKLSQ